MLIKLIKIYQQVISPYFPRRCRFYPSCSQYAVLAIEKYGMVKGVMLGLCRILRCHPLSRGGMDTP